MTELQIAIMNVLWEEDGATVAEVREALDERDLAISTVGTLLKRLVDSGVAGREKDGREYVYHAKLSQDDVRSTMVDDLVDWLFGGDAKALVSHLVDESEVDPAELDRLRERLRRSSPTDSPPGNSEDEASSNDS